MQLQLMSKTQAFTKNFGDASSFIKLLSMLSETDCLGAETFKTDKMLARMMTFFEKVGIESSDSFHTMQGRLFDTYLKRLQVIEGNLLNDLISVNPNLPLLILANNRKFPIQVSWGLRQSDYHAIAFDALGELNGNRGWFLFHVVESEQAGSRAVVADVTNDYGGYCVEKIRQIVGLPNAR